MRIFQIALLSALAFAQEDAGAEMTTEETTEEAPAEEEIDYDAPWTADVAWTANVQDLTSSRKFSKTNDNLTSDNAGLPTSITVITNEDGSKAVHLTMATGWKAMWENSTNKNFSDMYAALGWAMQAPDMVSTAEDGTETSEARWETAVMGATNDKGIKFAPLEQGMASSVDSPNWNARGLDAWGNKVDGEVAAWTIAEQGQETKTDRNRPYYVGLNVKAARPMSNEGITSTIDIKNQMTYKLCGAGWINRQGEAGWAESACADFMFDMPVKPEPEPEPVDPVVPDFANRLTSTAFAIVALFAINF